MNSEYETAIIVDDSDKDNDNNGNDNDNDNDNDSEDIVIIKNKIVKPRIKQTELKKYYTETPSVIEIGVDEAGRGPLFGRVYTAAVVLPQDDSFDHSKMKDSKKFHSKKKI